MIATALEVRTLFPIAAAAGGGILEEVRWNWDWSPLATGLILAACAVWVIAIYANEQRFVSKRSRAALALLRLMSVAIVLAMLAQPTIERRRVAPPRVAVLLDNSASMDVRDVPAADLAEAGGATARLTRREAWRHILTAGEASLLEAIRDRFDVALLHFSSTVDPMNDEALRAPTDGGALQGETPAEPPQGDRSSTQLGDALDHALRQLSGPRPAAVIVMTDGINTAGLPLSEATARARTLGVPLYTVALGSDRPRPDVRLDNVLVEEVVFPGDRLQLEAAIHAVGYEGKPAQVTLKRADGDAMLAETSLALPPDGEFQTIRLALRPTEPGPLHVELQVEAQPGEDDTANNRGELTIDVRDEPIRGLLIYGAPSFEYRALKSLLERDPAIDLRVWLQDADADYARVDEAALDEFPATEAELLQYDVVLLGDVDPRLLPRQTWELLHKFVSVHGGGLAAIAGERHMPHAFAEIGPMRTLLPIELFGAGSVHSSVSASGVLIQPTPLGLEQASLQLGETAAASAAIWNELPPVLWTLDSLRAKPGVQILAAGDRRAESCAATEPLPIIMRHYVGAGEVLMHATDETWRWRWRNDDRYFARYWGQAVRRLARGRALRGVGSLSTNRSEYDLGAPVTIRLRLSAPTPQHEAAQFVELAGESTHTREIRLARQGRYANLFDATLHDLPADRYTVRLVTAGPSAAPLSAEFTVAAPPGELAQLVVNADGLKEAATSTGGKFYTAKTAHRLRHELPRAEPAAIEQLPAKPLWNTHWFLAAICATLALEWLLRRRSGML